MIIKFTAGEKEFSADTGKPIDISIPLLFNGAQPNIYDVEKAEAKAYEAGEFIGDTRRGGSCNFEQFTFVAHCNGTHTECVGHITDERIYINDILKDAFIPAVLITVTPEKAEGSADRYIPQKEEDDMFITRAAIEKALSEQDSSFLKGLIIRTLPNDDSKRSRRYMDALPPFFSIDAMEYIDSLGIEHLLTDLPSVDKTFDEGKLTTHHIYWHVPAESHEIDKSGHSLRTITEMIYAPDEVKDGRYIVNIQIPGFASDAAPSRIMLYEVK